MAIVDKRPDAFELATPAREFIPIIRQADFDAHLADEHVVEQLARARALAKERAGNRQAEPPARA